MGSYYCPRCKQTRRVWWLHMFRQERHLRRCTVGIEAGVKP